MQYFEQMIRRVFRSLTILVLVMNLPCDGVEPGPMAAEHLHTVRAELPQQSVDLFVGAAPIETEHDT